MLFSVGASAGPVNISAKPPDSASMASGRSHMRPPHPQSSAGDSDPSGLRTPVKGLLLYPRVRFFYGPGDSYVLVIPLSDILCWVFLGDSSKGFQLQFGTISPGFVNGMQVLFLSEIS